MNLHSWMSAVPDSRELLTLNLVGTHDCVTQYVQLPHFSRCQDRSIREQLNIGIRALDIRVQSKGDRLKMLHGKAKAFNTPNRLSEQMDMSDVLRQCYAFLDENPSESIIFQFKNDSNLEMEKCFDNLYNTYIVPDSSRWYLGSASPLLEEVRGKLVLLRRCKRYEGKQYPLGTGIDFSAWVEQDEAVPEPLILKASEENPMTFIVQDRYKYKPKPRWSQCLLPFLDSMTPFGGEYVINYTSTAGGLKGPYNNAAYINPCFMEYELKDGIYYGMIYTDFPTPQLVEKVIKTNFTYNKEA